MRQAPSSLCTELRKELHTGCMQPLYLFSDSGETGLGHPRTRPGIGGLAAERFAGQHQLPSDTSSPSGGTNHIS